jgi:hypothetical protein
MDRQSFRTWCEEQKEFLEIMFHLYSYTMKKIFLTPYYQFKEIGKILKEEISSFTRDKKKQ